MVNKVALVQYKEKSLPLTELDEFVQLIDASGSKPSLGMAIVYYHACLLSQVLSEGDDATDESALESLNLLLSAT